MHAYIHTHICVCVYVCRQASDYNIVCQIAQITRISASQIFTTVHSFLVFWYSHPNYFDN
jgi:hypothetical protein